MQRLLENVRYRALRLRHDWWYRWAHDPLCERLGGGVLTIGRLRLCRSCVAMYAGIATGAASAVAVPAVGVATMAPRVWLASAAALAGVSVPSVYRDLGRHQKDAIRFGTGMTGGLLIAFLLAKRWLWTAALSAVAGIGYRVLTLARATSKATACEGCPELGGASICSGFAQQAVSLRAYEQQASELAMRSYRPSVGASSK